MVLNIVARALLLPTTSLPPSYHPCTTCLLVSTLLTTAFLGCRGTLCCGWVWWWGNYTTGLTLPQLPHTPLPLCVLLSPYMLEGDDTHLTCSIMPPFSSISMAWRIKDRIWRGWRKEGTGQTFGDHIFLTSPQKLLPQLLLPYLL